VFDLALRHSVYSSFACSTSKVRDKPIRKTPTIEQFNQIIGSIRSQQFNGHNADDSADFPEFIGLAGLGQAEASALTWDDID